MIAYLLITWVIVLIVDRASEWTRKHVGWMQLAPEEIAG
jgi:ABC-type phosphate/phosphonate transport system permease subunit